LNNSSGLTCSGAGFSTTAGGFSFGETSFGGITSLTAGSFAGIDLNLLFNS